MKNQLLTCFKGILFDVDGTLVDSNDLHAKAFQDAFLAVGLQIDYRKIRRCVGMGADKLIPACLERPVSEEEIEKIGKRKSEIFQKKYLSEVKPFPKVPELLRELKACQLTLALASSASQEELKSLLHTGHLEIFFDASTSADDATRSKPDPDIVCEAIHKTGLKKTDLLMIGDTPYDVEAAQRAGIHLIAFRCGGWKDQDLHGAVQIYDGAWEMFHDLFGGT